MNLKNASIIALILIIVSTLLYICGNILYIPLILKDHINLPTLISVSSSTTLPVLFRSLGVVLLLSAVISRLSKPNSGRGSTLAIFAGVLILLCTLFTIITSITQAVSLYRHLPLSRSLFYTISYAIQIVSGLALGLFALTISGRSSGKVLALLALISYIASLLVNLGNLVITFGETFAQLNFLMDLVRIGMILGSFGITIAIIFFLLVFLKQKHWPPMADVRDSLPNPLPILSGQTPFPEG